MKLFQNKYHYLKAALYTDDARFLPSGAPPIEGRAAIQQAFEGLLQGIARVQLDTVEVEGHGDTAHEQEALTFFDANGTKVDEGKAIVIWKKVGAEWRLHRDIFNSNLPPPPPAAPAEGAAADGVEGAAGAAAEGAEPPAEG
jgi:ketosteroid isomerase-like protein